MESSVGAHSWSLRLLGPPELSGGSGSPRFARRKSLALLAYLAVEDRSHARDGLACLLWPECDQARARGNLRSSLFELSRGLGADWALRSGELVALNPAVVRSDVEGVLRAATVCGACDGKPSCRECGSGAPVAVASWNGGFMSGFTLAGCPDFDDWQFRWSTRLRECFVLAARRIAKGYRRAGAAREAELLAERWIEAEPFDETARRAQLECLLDQGLVSAAQDCLDAWERVCRTELGRSPSAGLAELVRAAAARADGPGAARAACPGPVSARRGRPSRGADEGLLGREGELEHLHEEVFRGRRRAFCLTGPGGIGKTALAREFLAREAGRFPGGAAFVDCSAERDASRLPFRIGAVLGLRETAAEPEAMVRLLEARIGQAPTLLVLDNLEQLPAAGSRLAPLLDACRSLVLVATSRGSPGLPGESTLALGPLACPPARDADDSRAAAEDAAGRPAALTLFLRAARRAAPDFFPEGEELEACAALCRRLEGIPLALELAAARMALLDPGELLGRLEAGGGMPSRADRSGYERHRSVEALLRWSLELLPPWERRLYAALSVFLGPFSLEEAEVVLRDFRLEPEDGDGEAGVARGLEELAASSLLRRERLEEGLRFSFFQVLREPIELARAALPEDGALRDRAAALFAARARNSSLAVRGAGQLRELRALARAEADFEAALERLLRGGRVAEALGLCADLEWAWFRSGRFATGASCLERALDFGGGAPGPRGACLRALGWLRFTQGAWHEAHARFLEALPLLEEAGDGRGLIRCLADLGVVERWLGNRVGGEERCCMAVESARALGEPGLLAQALVWGLGTTGGRPGTEEQRRGLEEAVLLARRAGEPWMEAHAHESLGDLLRVRGERGAAQVRYELARRGFTRLEDRWMLAWTLEGYGMNEAAAGRPGRGLDLLAEAFRLFSGLGARGDAAYALGELGSLSVAAGGRPEADFLLGAFASARSELGLETLAQYAEPLSNRSSGGLEALLEEAARRDGEAWRRGLRAGTAEVLSELAAAATNLQRPAD